MEWINSLLNGENGSAVQLILITVGLVLALILIFWLFRRIAGTPARRAARNRVPRLSITDVTAVDDKRFLVLARRDNVEHLVLIGGPTDVVVETGIIRAQQPQSGQNTQKQRVPEQVSAAPTRQEPEAKAEPENAPAPVAATVAATATGLAASAAAATASAAETVGDLASSAVETATETVETVAETATETVNDILDVTDEPVVAESASLEDAEIDLKLDESDLEATLTDALATEDLTVEASVEPEPPVEPTSLDAVPEEIAISVAGDTDATSPDDEMQKLLAELASETKEPA